MNISDHLFGRHGTSARGRNPSLVRVIAVLALLAIVVPIPLVAAPPASHADLPGAKSMITICHRPPGNPSNAQIIRVAQSAVAGHVAHGDPIGDASLDMFYVDATAEYPGNGRSESPFRRITDAIRLARCIRQATDDYDSAAEPLEIRVAPGEYLGTYTADKLSEDQTLEELPIILNVPNLILRGSTTPVLDDDGRPTGEANGPETIIAGADPLAGYEEVLFVVTDTNDGMVGNRTTVEGFTLKSGNPRDAGGGIGVIALRVEGFVLRHNIFDDSFAVAIDPRAASGTVSTNHIRDASVGMFVEGPGTVDILSNRVLATWGGVYLATTVMDFPFSLGVQGEELSIEPFEVPSVAHLDGAITNNDLSGHALDEYFSFGLRLSLYGHGTASHVTEQSLRYAVSDNTIQNNVFGVVIDAGFSARNDLTPTGEFLGAFRGNDVSGNCRAPLLVTFTRWNAALFPEQVSVYPYLQDSTYSVTFADGDEDIFEDRWIDHPIEDPEDGRKLNNVYLENGAAVAPGTRIVPFDPENPDPCVFD